MESLIHIWKNNGTRPLEDSTRVACIKEDTNDPAELLLLGSYHLFKGNLKKGFPLLLQVRRYDKGANDEVQYIALMAILNMYNKMFRIGNGFLYHYQQLDAMDAENSAKEAWKVIFRMKFNGSLQKTQTNVDTYEDWLEEGRKFYDRHELSEAQQALILYQLGAGLKRDRMYAEAQQYFYKVIGFSKDRPQLRHTLFNTYLLMAGIKSDLAATDSLNSDPAKYDSARHYYALTKSVQTDSDPALYALNFSSSIGTDYFAKKGAWDSAYKYLDSTIKEIYPVYTEQNMVWVNDATEKFQADIRNDKIVSQRKQLTLTVISIVLLFALLITLAQALSRIRKKNKRIETLMRELHHRVKNNLQIVSSLLGLQSLRMKDETAKKAVSEARSRIRAMSMVHKRLYQHENIDSLNIKDYLTSLVNELVQAYGNVNRIKLQLDITNDPFDSDSALPIGLMVNELITNALKHGLVGVRDPLIRLSLKSDGDHYELVIGDNGPGVEDLKAIQTSNSFGYKLVEILTRQINGQMSLANQPGLTYHITFKI